MQVFPTDLSPTTTIFKFSFSYKVDLEPTKPNAGTLESFILLFGVIEMAEKLLVLVL
jgi:hypothetical protein